MNLLTILGLMKVFMLLVYFSLGGIAFSQSGPHAYHVEKTHELVGKWAVQRINEDVVSIDIFFEFLPNGKVILNGVDSVSGETFFSEGEVLLVKDGALVVRELVRKISGEKEIDQTERFEGGDVYELEYLLSENGSRLVLTEEGDSFWAVLSQTFVMLEKVAPKEDVPIRTKDRSGAERSPPKEGTEPTESLVPLPERDGPR